MKPFTLTLILFTMFFSLNAQKTVYNSDNVKLTFKKEKSELCLEESDIKIPQKESQEVGFSSLIPTAVDLGFKIATNALEKRQKKFSGEYSNQTSYLKAGNKSIPNIEFKREVEIDDTFEDSFTIKLLAVKIENLDGFYYYVDSLNLKYSKAKTTSKSKMFDYTIEIKPTFFVDGEKKSQELSPIKLTSIEFGKTELDAHKYRTEIIPLPKGSSFAEVSIKIVETNPAKVKADKILETYNTYKDDVKTVINNFVKTEDSSSSDDENSDPNETDEN